MIKNKVTGNTKCFLWCCRKKSSLNQNKINQTFLIGKNKLKNESNIIGILQTIQKLKAAVTVLVKENKELVS